MTWHFVSSPSSPVPGVESWEGSCLAGAPSALLKLIPMPEACCSHGNATGCSSRSPCGTTLEPSTGDRGAGTSTSLAGDSLAKTFHALAPAPGSPASNQGFGLSLLASLATFDRVTCSWKTRQISLLGGSESFSETWPRAGMMRDGTCWELTTSAPPTSATESGSWHTPRAHLKGWGVGRHMTKAQQRRTRADVHSTVLAEVDKYGQDPRPSRIEWLMMWPIGWSALRPLATDKFQRWFASHGKR
jgi:hypothetical protein